MYSRLPSKSYAAQPHQHTIYSYVDPASVVLLTVGVPILQPRIARTKRGAECVVWASRVSHDRTNLEPIKPKWLFR